MVDRATVVPTLKSLMDFTLDSADLAWPDLSGAHFVLVWFPALWNLSDTLYSAACSPHAPPGLLSHTCIVANGHRWPVLPRYAIIL